MQVASFADVINQGAFKSTVTCQGQNYEISVSCNIILNQELKNLPLSLQKFC